MIDLPKSTEFNKRIPKQKFYDNIDLPQNIKRAFKDEIKLIYWKNKIAPSTVNIAAGDEVKEIEIFEIKLNVKELSEKVLLQIDRAIPYHILFILQFEDKERAYIGYKEQSQNGKLSFKVGKYYATEWSPIGTIDLSLDGLNMDLVYENLIRQVAGGVLSKETGESIKESVARDEKREQILKEISLLESKMRKEKQLNKCMEINTRIKDLKRML